MGGRRSFLNETCFLTYFSSAVQPIYRTMSLWREDLSTSSLQEVLDSQAENQLWSKELRRKSSALVNSRLAKNISQSEYLLTRALTDKEAVECRRRSQILIEHLIRYANGGEDRMRKL